jgi:probable HAF family extracellular repeat protein
MALNERGEVVGFSNVSAAAGGSFAVQAFLWTRHGGIRRLGVLPGDAASQALGINSSGQVVGTSCDAKGNCRAFIWRDGVMRNLNSLVRGYHGTLVAANDINDSGVITGQAQLGTGALVAFAGRPRQ